VVGSALLVQQAEIVDYRAGAGPIGSGGNDPGRSAGRHPESDSRFFAMRAQAHVRRA